MAAGNPASTTRLCCSGEQHRGQLAHAVAEEGGTPSLFWAGGERVRYQRKRPPQRVLLSFEGEEYGYELQVGLPFNHSMNICS